jgi:L-aspartate oxidase
MSEPPYLRADVVVGGGVAGCAAALSAARRGASVLMLTKIPIPIPRRPIPATPRAA